MADKNSNSVLSVHDFSNQKQLATARKYGVFRSEPKVVANTIFRPDTAYLHSHCLWVPEVVQTITTGLSELVSPSVRNILTRIEEYFAELDPFAAEEARRLPWRELYEQVKARETEAAVLCDGTEDEIPEKVLTIGGKNFVLIPWSGRRGCKFQLQGDGICVHGRISEPHPKSPNLYVEIGSIPFWRCANWIEYLESWEVWLSKVSMSKDCWHISRIDMAFHTQALTSDHIDRDFFSCRAQAGRVYSKPEFLDQLDAAIARDADLHRQGRHDEAIYASKLSEKWRNEPGMCEVDFFRGMKRQMITYGTRSRLYCRIYNKTKEMCRNPQKMAVFGEVYARHGFNMQRDVINVEFELGRSWLMNREFTREKLKFTVDTVADFVRHHETITGYLLGTDHQNGWLRMIKPINSRNENCPTNDMWKLVQEATAYIPQVEARQRQLARARLSIGQMMPQWVRCLSRMYAAAGRRFDPKGEVTVQTFIDAMHEMASAEWDKKYGISAHKCMAIFEAESVRSGSPSFFDDSTTTNQPLAMPA